MLAKLGAGYREQTIWGHTRNVLPAPSSPPFIQASQFDSDGHVSAWNVCSHHILLEVHHFYANGCWSKGVFFFFSSLNHVPHSIGQRVYTFYSNVFCKPISCEILINSYFKASL